MRQLLTIALLVLFAAGAAAQDTTSRDAGKRGYFGAPVVKYTAIRDQGALMFGGRGGWNVTSSLLLGGGLYGTMTEVDAREGAVPEVPGSYDVKFESFGFELEYAAHPAAPTHFTLNAFLGGGAVRYAKDKTDEQEGESDFVLLFEPAAGVERTITQWLHLNLAAFYRLAGGVEQPDLKNGDLNGPGVSLAFKIGRI